MKSRKIKYFLFAIASAFIGVYYSIGALGEKAFNPLYPYVFFSGLLLFFGVKNGLKKSQTKAVAPFMFFIAFGFFTLLWSPTQEYGYTKIFNLLGLNMFFMVAAGLIVKNFNRFNFYLLIGVFLSIVFLYIGIGSPGKVLASLSIEGRLGGGDDSVGIIGIGRFLAFGDLCICYLFLKTNSKFKKGLLVVLFILTSSYMIFSGTRGAIYGLILAIIFMIYFSVDSSKKRLKYSMVIISTSIFLLFLYDNFAGDILHDFIIKRLNSESGNTRLQIYLDTIKAYFNLNWFQFVFGAGSGAAADVVVHSGGGIPISGYQRMYPHNIFLEILYEYGIIGIILFFKVCISPFLLNLKKIKSAGQTTLFLMGFWLYWFFNSLVSTDIMGNFLLFGFSIVLTYNYYYKKNILRKNIILEK